MESGTAHLAPLSPVHRIPLNEFATDTVSTVSRPPSVRANSPGTITGRPVRTVSADIVVGPENCLVELAIRQLVKERSGDKTQYLNPLVLVGPTGGGKSRLASGLAATCFNGQGTQFTTADQWSREYGQACKREELSHWQKLQRNVRLFALDDLRFLAKKKTAQRELCLLIDDLIAAGIPVILTCQRHPTNDPDLISSLSSRLTAGLLIFLQDPALESRLSLITLFAKQNGWSLSTEAKAVAAAEITGTVAEIQRTLLRCLQQTQSWDKEERITGAQLRQLIRQIQPTRIPTLNDILKSVSKYTAVPTKAMLSENRRADIVLARSLAMFLSRQMTNLSFTEIGQFYGGRNHTTVMHACRKMKNNLRSDSNLNETVQNIKQIMTHKQSE